MQPFQGNLPDLIWSRLKEWAKTTAASQTPPTSDECVAIVLRIVAGITGRPESLRPEVVAFYANETAEMVAKCREQTGSVGATDLEAAI
jgi:hypothetical protein